MSFKLTEREQVSKVKEVASILITQLEGAEGSEIESLRRATLEAIAPALRKAMNINELDEMAQGAYPTASASGRVVTFDRAADDVPVKALVVAIEPTQSGSGDPAPDNVHPISGWTGATVTRLGKNLANIADNTYTNSGVTFTASAGAVHMTGTSTGTINRTIGTVQLLAGVTYTISGTKASSITDANVLRIDLRNTGGSVIASGDSYNGFVYTPEEDVTAQVNIRMASGQTIDATLYPQVEAGRKATAFEPYAPTSWAVDWSSAAGTVYRGTLDVVTGVLTVTHGVLTIDSSNIDNIRKGSTTSRDEYYIPAPDGSVFDGVKRYVTISECASAGMICSVAPFADPDHLSNNYMATAYLGAEGTTLQLRLNIALSEGVDTVEKMKQLATTLYAAGTPIQYVYPLKNQATYQLTPTEVRTLLGMNTMISDAGDMSITYHIDPMQYAVTSVAGKGGNVTLDGNDVSFSIVGTYGRNTVGQHLQETENNLFLLGQEVAMLGGNKIPFYMDGDYPSEKTIADVINDLQEALAASEAQRLATYPTDTVEGTTATFSDGADDVPVKALSITMMPVQSGSGDPSTANIRPISGRTMANINANGTTIPIAFPTEAGTVYGGTLDVLTGELTINWIRFETTWGAGTSARAVGTTIISKIYTLPTMSKSSGKSGDSICNICSYALGNSETEHYYILWQQVGADFVTKATVYLPDETNDDQVIQIAYAVGTPETYHLDPQTLEQIKTQLGNNVIYADCGDVSVTYRADPTLYINRKIAEALQTCLAAHTETNTLTLSSAE